MKGAAATGHPLTTEAAVRMLEKGGNAFDAITAAGFAAAVTESIFASLGGGGFLLGHLHEQNTEFLYDFFVSTPGKGLDISEKPVMEPLGVQFSEAIQVYYIGMASIGVPGTLRGLAHLYSTHCTLDLDDLIAPAIEFLEEGIEMTESQKYILRVVQPIFDRDPYGREVFNYSKNNKLYNPLLKEFYKKRSIDAWLQTMYLGPETEPFLSDMRKGGGRITYEDLHSYSVIERSPIHVNYRGYEYVSNPPPSFGGAVIAQALSKLNNEEYPKNDPVKAILMRAEMLKLMNRLKAGGGTTHMNTIDAKGNVAAMSLSAGTGCGYFFPSTGILMNNTMGEEDLHPGAFYADKPGARVPSMMSPSFIKKQGEILYSLGTGGSSRIRSAIFQVVLNLIDMGMNIEEAVEAPRLHIDEEGRLQAEPIMDTAVLEALKSHYADLNLWTKKDLYFGGVHTISGNYCGWGDSRRGGVFKRILY